jgi:hypothetical protein
VESVTDRKAIRAITASGADASRVEHDGMMSGKRKRRLTGGQTRA